MFVIISDLDISIFTSFSLSMFTEDDNITIKNEDRKNI